MGYPNGLRVVDISVSVRITALIDVFDALGSKRSYKRAWSDAQVTEHIYAGSGSQFDFHLVEVLMAYLNVFGALRHQYLDLDEHLTCASLRLSLARPACTSG